MVDSEATAMQPRPLWLLVPGYLAAVTVLYVALSLVSQDLIDQRHGESLLLVFVALFPLLVGLTAYFLHLDAETHRDIGVKRGVRSTARDLLAWPLLTTGFLLAWLGFTALLARVELVGPSARFAAGPSWLRGHGVLALVVVALGFAVQSACEEWVFRGYLLHVFERSRGFVVATLATATLFALAHGTSPAQTPLGLVNTFLLGIGLAFVARSSGSLWAPVAVHATWNFVLGSLMSLSVSGVDIYHMVDVQLDGGRWITGGDYGPEASALLTPLLVIAAALLGRGILSRTPSSSSEAGIIAVGET